MVVKIGDRIRIDIFNHKHKKVITGRVIKEYEHHFLLKNKNYRFSLNKIDLISPIDMMIRKLN